MALEWILLVAGVKQDEMIAGALSMIAAGCFLYVTFRAESQRLTFTLRDLSTCWRIPWYIVSGSWKITVVLLKDILGIAKAGSFYRVCGFRTSKDDPLLVARRVLAIAYTTTTPNFIVIGIDYTKNRMLFHQIERSSVPKMAEELGAQS